MDGTTQQKGDQKKLFREIRVVHIPMTFVMANLMARLFTIFITICIAHFIAIFTTMFTAVLFQASGCPCREGNSEKK